VIGGKAATPREELRSMKVSVKVKPGSKAEEVIQEGDSLIVKVKERPIKGEANRAVIKLLARHFGRPESAVTISQGFRSRTKVIEVL
jgi:uncharacterized protein (TIGR00251 family)